MRRSNKNTAVLALIAIIARVLFIFLRAVHKKKLWLEFFVTTGSTILSSYLVYVYFNAYFNMDLGVSLVLYFSYWIYMLKFHKTKNISHRWLNEEFWRTINPFRFEDEIAALFIALGYDAHVTPERGDYGVDVVATVGRVRTAIQCKRYNDHKVICKDVRDLWGAKDYYNCENAIMIALDGATWNARNFTKRFGKKYRIFTLKEILEYAEEVIVHNKRNLLD